MRVIIPFECDVLVADLVFCDLIIIFDGVH